MNSPTPQTGLDQLIDKAAQHVAHEQQVTQAALAKQARKFKTQQILFTVLLVVLLGVAFVQAPKFSEPFASVDPTKSPAVAEADLELMVGLVESYRLSQGRYPTALSDVTLPPTLASVFAKGTLSYVNQGEHFALEWLLPPWHLRYDGQSKALIAKATPGK